MIIFSIIAVTPVYCLVISVLGEMLDYIVISFLFTVMGLVLNAELISPYVAFILVVTRNMYLCYSNLQSKYKEVKGMISKQWKENTRDLPWVHSGSDDTIPKDLACNRMFFH